MTRLQAAIAVVVFVSLLTLLGPQREASLPLTATWDEQVHYWRGRIASIGPQKSYAEYAAYATQLNPGLQHQWVHAFGQALYKQEGVDALSICDSQFNFGCFHQFLSDAILDLGIERVGDINARCFDALSDNPLSCQHGIGHGILAAVGYDFPSLKKSLDVCASLAGTDPIGGCYSGTFMEYNVRTMMGERAQPRPMSGDAYAPCNMVRPEYKSACIFWQPQWWLQISFRNEDHESAFKHLGELCSAYANPELRRYCFEGIGNITGMEAGFDPLRARALCDLTSSIPIDALYCRSLAANSLSVGGGGKMGDGMQVCSDLVGNSKQFCEGYAMNRLNSLNRGDSSKI